MQRQDSTSFRARALLAGGAAGLALLLFLLAPLAQAALPDGRGWELVSPLDKNGGGVASAAGPAEARLGGGVFKAAAGGGAFAFPSSASFGGGEGAAPISQYVATRSASGWNSANVTPPLLSGTYEGDPYLFFSSDLSRAILSNGWACRGGGETCEAENPPLGPQAPPGYRNLYLREGDAYTPLVTESNFPTLPADPSEFHLALQGASPDARHIVISVQSQLYEWNAGALTAIGAPGAMLAGPSGAVSVDGSRVYFTEFEDGFLYLHEGSSTKLLSAVPGSSFQLASSDGSLAFYVAGGQLFRYSATSETSTDLGAAVAVAAISPDGSYVYYVTSEGLYLLHGGATTKILSASPSHLPPASGTATASADGSRLFFTSPNPLQSSDTNGRPDAYEWEATGAGSCAASPGCIFLISSGRVGEAHLLDSSSDGSDAYFLTEASLVGLDPEANDVYDARVGGGFSEPPSPIPCEGDACQGPAPGPEDPTPGTATFEGPANPPLQAGKKHHRHHKKKHRHHRRGRR
jgi:hypothetical protein